MLGKTNIYILGAPGGEEREKWIKHVFQEIIENSQNLKKETDIHVQEAQRVPNKMNPSWPKPRQSIIKMASIEDNKRILKAAGEKQRVRY